MRFMLDTMIFDCIVADALLTDEVIQAVDAGRLTIVTTHVQEDQIAAIPDFPDGQREKKTAISRIPRRIVPTTGFAFDISSLGMASFADEETSATIERIGRRRLRDVADGLIAVSARAEADAFVTNDAELQKRILREGVNVTLFTFEDFRRHVLSPRDKA
jgi:hypothetical protein